MIDAKINWENHIIRNYKELFQSVLPFWLNNCPDKKYGGYFTFLDRDGSVYDSDKFMWMEWRIVYMFAKIYTFLEKDTQAAQYILENDLDFVKDQLQSQALQGYEFLTSHGKDERGQYYFGLNREGDPIVAPYNIYSQAFAVMGAAALYMITKKEAHKEEALDAMEKYIARLDNPKGKWEKGLAAQKDFVSLGHYMILANLGAVLQECIGVERYQDYIEKAVSMVLNHFYNPELEVIFENILPNSPSESNSAPVHNKYKFDLSSTDGRHLNPGHGLEACWFCLDFLLNSEGSASSEKAREKVADMILNQLKWGWDGSFGGIFYFLDARYKPHVELTWDMKLWWVHNEALLAILYGYYYSLKDSSVEGEPFLRWFHKVDGWAWEHFPDKKNGEWFGYLNRRGEPTHYLKGGKWKTCFHLPRYLLKSIELMKNIKNLD